MFDDRIQVHTETLRECAAELTATAYRLGHRVAGTPGLTVSAPGWAAGVSLADLETAVDAYLRGVGVRAAEAATRLRTAARKYEAADERAARRLSGW